jgi:two-component system OmpR family response regulator
VPGRTRKLALLGQAFALIGTMLGLFTIFLGIGPQSAPDLVFHLALLALLLAGLYFARRASFYDGRMPRILLIDDDEHLAAPLAAYFARFDFVLDSALRPGEGLAKLRAGAYDAAILDVMLPEMDGFALCREIRKESDIPVIMLTARGDVMDRVVGLELGADDYLPKPFEPRELVARVQTILRRQRAVPPAGPRRVFEGLVINT